MNPNVPMTGFENNMFSTVGNVGIAGNRMVNLQKNNPFPQGGLPPGYGPQTINICVNGVAGHIVVIAQPPVQG
jgi:hypothetical protein